MDSMFPWRVLEDSALRAAIVVTETPSGEAGAWSSLSLREQ
jgi:hypothetical protein